MQDNRVIWLEGMFIQPQHFQQQERYFENLLHAGTTGIEKNLWGFSEIQLDTQLLSIGKIGISIAKGFFQDGTLISIPDRDQAPIAFDVPGGMDNTILYLCIPMRGTTPEAGDAQYKDPVRYRVISKEIRDNTAGNDQTADIRVGSLSSLILSEQDERTGFHCLQFCKVSEARSNHMISLDKSFLPDCLNVHANRQLSQVITEFHGLLHHRAEMLAGRLTDTQQAGTAEIVDFMLLQLVNRHEMIFHYLERKVPLHPEQLYSALIQLMGEMATFTNDRRRPDEPPEYRHDQLFGTFQPLICELRNALSRVLEQNATSVALQAQQHGLWVGQFSEKDLIAKCSFVLAVYSDLPADTLRNAFTSQVKIAPVEQIRTLVSRQLPGIELQPIAIAPRQIPYHANFSYFAVNTRNELWKLLDKSAGIAFHVGSQFPNLKMELWAIRG